MSPGFKSFLARVLAWEAKMVLRKYQPKIVAITGSVGKTGAKDAVHAVLKEFYAVRKSEKSFNSEIGLPLTILGLPNAWNNKWQWFKNLFLGLKLILRRQEYPEWLVLEAGVGKPGDMAWIASIIHADVTVFTYFGDRPVHVEMFDSIADVVKEKSKLVSALRDTGTLVLNADDPKVLALKDNIAQPYLTYGFKEGADLQATHEAIMQGDPSRPDALGVAFRVDYDGHSIPVALDGVFGRSYVYAALAALSVAKALDLNMLVAAKALRQYDIQPGRLRVLPGVKDTLVIDDTYNSSPAACEMAIETLAALRTPGKKIAVLGDMLELGKYTEEAHREIGALLKRKKIDILVAVGPRSHFFMEGAKEAGMSEKKMFHFSRSREAGKFVEERIKEGDCVLVKGSQGMRMERAVQEIMAHPEDREKLLARQDPEWLKRQ